MITKTRNTTLNMVQKTNFFIVCGLMVKNNTTQLLFQVAAT